MSGYLALKRDLAGMGESLDLFAEVIETGAQRHRVEDPEKIDTVQRFFEILVEIVASETVR